MSNVIPILTVAVPPAPVPTRFDVCSDPGCGHWRFYHDDDEEALCVISVPAKGECPCTGFKWSPDDY